MLAAGLKQWLFTLHVQTQYIDPGSPWDAAGGAPEQRCFREQGRAMSESKKPAWSDNRISRAQPAKGECFFVYCLALCVGIVFSPAGAYAAAKGKQPVLSPETTVCCGNFTYTLPPGYVAKKDRSPLTNPHMILLNPPVKKSVKDMWESQMFCLEDSICVEPGVSAFRMRQRFDVRSTAKLSDKLEIWESAPLAGGQVTLHLLGKIIPYAEGSVPFVEWDNPPYYHPIIPVIERTNTETGRAHYLVLVENRMERWPDRMLPEESKEEKRQRMRKLAEEVFASQKPEPRPNAR